MKTEQAIAQFVEHTRQLINQVETLKNIDWNTLNWRASQTSWSILECIAHLNLYGDFYLPQMEQKIKQSTTSQTAELKKGILGGYFAKSMLPSEKGNKMKTFKDKDPIHSALDIRELDTFINQQMRLLAILQQARKVNLNKVKIETSISRFIRINLGDTFAFYINHMIRHVHQIERIKGGFSNEER